MQFLLKAATWSNSSLCKRTSGNSLKRVFLQRSIPHYYKTRIHVSDRTDEYLSSYGADLETQGGQRGTASRGEDLSKKILSSFKLLEGCPWAVPRPLYVLAVESEWLGPDNASMYLIQARMEKSQASEIGMVLGMDKLHVSALRDGVVAFNNVQDAEAYSLQLQNEIGQEAIVATFDSHELFRMADDVKAVVVYLAGDNGFIPTPMQLASYARGEDPWDQL